MTNQIVATYAPCCGTVRIGDLEPGVMHCALPHERKLMKLVDAAEYEAVERALRDLLARIHRDGGHHTDAVGLAQSVKDAESIVCRWAR